MELTTFPVLELSLVLEYMDQNMLPGYHLKDFGGGNTLIPVPGEKSGTIETIVFGIERESDHKTQLFELYAPKETING